jgi:hypothetical protein
MEFMKAHDFNPISLHPVLSGQEKESGSLQQDSNASIIT